MSAKKGSALVSHTKALEAALCYGWIDGQKQAHTMPGQPSLPVLQSLQVNKGDSRAHCRFDRMARFRSSMGNVLVRMMQRS